MWSSFDVIAATVTKINYLQLIQWFGFIFIACHCFIRLFFSTVVECVSMMMVLKYSIQNTYNNIGEAHLTLIIKDICKFDNRISVYQSRTLIISRYSHIVQNMQFFFNDFALERLKHIHNLNQRTIYAFFCWVLIFFFLQIMRLYSVLPIFQFDYGLRLLLSYKLFHLSRSLLRKHWF